MQQLSFDDLEIWRPVVGYEGLYDVSSLGRVKSLERLSLSGKRIRERILKPLPTARYPGVTLHRERIQTRHYIHRLVALAFLGPCPEGQEVRHKDGGRDCPRLSNLEYGTHAENMQDMVLHGKCYWTNRTHCRHGHRFTPENTLIRRELGRVTGRRCRQCAKDRSRNRRLREKEAA
jgi:hypothetical protein